MIHSTDPRTLLRRLQDRRPDSHKYDYGHVLVIGGSPGMVGAPLLAGKAALRTGAGLVTIASTAEVTDKLEKRVEEIMTLSLPPQATAAIRVLKTFVKDRKVTAIVMGPGLRADEYAGDVIQRLLKSFDLPLIIDGGGLGIVSTKLSLLDTAISKSLILTPHLGEFQRIQLRPLPAKRVELQTVAARFAKAHGVTVVLKGHPTYVAQKDGSIYENTTGNPGMATAGTGDVLSGVIAGLISQGIEPEAAAEAAVYLHGLAGDLAASQKTQPGMIASDVIEYIPVAFKHIAAKVLRREDS